MKLRLKFENGTPVSVIEVSDTVTIKTLYETISEQFHLQPTAFFLSLNKANVFDLQGADHSKTLKSLGIVSGDLVYVLSSRPVLVQESSIKASKLLAEDDPSPSHVTVTALSKQNESASRPPTRTSPAYHANAKLLKARLDAFKIEEPSQIATVTVHYLLVNNGFFHDISNTELPAGWQGQLQSNGLLRLRYQHAQSDVSLNVTCLQLSNALLSSRKEIPQVVCLKLTALCVIGDDSRIVEMNVDLKEFKTIFESTTKFDEFVQTVVKNFIEPIKLNIIGYTNCPLLNLPSRILVRIAQSLTFYSLLQLCKCCRRLREILYDEQKIWRHFLIRDFEDRNEHDNYRDQYIRNYIASKPLRTPFLPGPTPIQPLPTAPNQPNPSMPPLFPDHNPYPDDIPYAPYLPRPGQQPIRPGVIGGMHDLFPPPFNPARPRLDGTNPRIFPRFPDPDKRIGRGGGGGGGFFGEGGSFI